MYVDNILVLWVADVGCGNAGGGALKFDCIGKFYIHVIIF